MVASLYGGRYWTRSMYGWTFDRSECWWRELMERCALTGVVREVAGATTL